MSHTFRWAIPVVLYRITNIGEVTVKHNLQYLYLYLPGTDYYGTTQRPIYYATTENQRETGIVNP